MSMSILPNRAPSQPAPASFVPGQLVVGLLVPLQSAVVILARVGATVIQHMANLDAVVIAVPVGKELETIKKLEGNQAFRYVETNGMHSTCTDTRGFA